MPLVTDPVTGGSYLDIPAAPVFQPLLVPAKYKAVYGGRGSAKSHFFADQVIAYSLKEKCDIICIREIQMSLDQSVKKLIEVKIEAHGLGKKFRVLQSHIESYLGGRIGFQGMQNHTNDTIKSLEGYKVAWVEEAQSLSQRSLDLLRPTLRVDGCEYWFSWNPDKPTDAVDAFFRAADPPPGSIVVKANYRDNPWLPETLKAEIEYDKRRDPDKYAHVWLGQYQERSEARVFKNWKIEEFERPPGTIFRFGADWGFSIDPAVLVRGSIDGNRLYIDYEAYMVGCEIVNLPDLFRKVPEAEKWWITADSARPETISYMQKHGFPKMNAAMKGKNSIEEGIAFMQSFDIVIHPRCVNVIDEVSTFSYKIDKDTDAVLPILQDKRNHTIDSCLVAGTLVKTLDGDKCIEDVFEGDFALTRHGYKRVLFAGVTDVYRPVVEVRTTVGSFVCTPDHQVWTENRGWIQADALRYNDEVISYKESSWKSNIAARFTETIQRVKISLIECISKITQLGSIDRCGWTTTAPYLQSVTYTTSTATATNYRISNVLRQKNIVRSILGANKEKLPNWDCSKESGRLLRNGTPAKKGLQSTGKLAEWLIPILSRSLNFVHNAMRSFFLKLSGTGTYFAPVPVNPHGAEIQASTTKNEFARAGKNLSVTNTPKLKLVPGHVLTITSNGVADKVYDLTIQDQPEFFANGILVHNCRYMLEGLRRAGVKAHEKEKKVRPVYSHGWMAA